ncbi:glycosyltransferase [Chloroflexota bacterium]
MKICFLINVSSIHAERWLSYFTQMGHDVHAVSFESPTLRIERVHYHIVPANKKLLWFTFIFKLVKIRRIIGEIKPDIIDAHYVVKYGAVAALSNSHPLVVTAMGSDILILSRENAIWRLVAKYVLGKTDLIVCRSPVVQKQILKLGMPVNKVRIIIPGVDTGRFLPLPKDVRLLQKLEIRPSDPVVISTRSLSPVYDVEALVRAVPLVLSEEPEVQFLIIGHGVQGNHLRKIAQELGVMASVRFVGWISHAEIPRYLSSSDIYVSTSLSDGTPNSLLEAMSCELAPVVTSIPANQRWIKDGKNGYLVPIKDPTTLGNRIISLIKNEKERKTFGIKNRKIVQEKAEQKAEMKKLGAVYLDLVAGRMKNE